MIDAQIADPDACAALDRSRIERYLDTHGWMRDPAPTTSPDGQVVGHTWWTGPINQQTALRMYRDDLTRIAVVLVPEHRGVPNYTNLMVVLVQSLAAAEGRSELDAFTALGGTVGAYQPATRPAPDRAMVLPDQPRGRLIEALGAAARDVIIQDLEAAAELVRVADAARDQAQATRDALIYKAAGFGLSDREIGRHVNLSPPRVGTIIDNRRTEKQAGPDPMAEARAELRAEAVRDLQAAAGELKQAETACSQARAHRDTLIVHAAELGLLSQEIGEHARLTAHQVDAIVHAKRPKAMETAPAGPSVDVPDELREQVQQAALVNIANATAQLRSVEIRRDVAQARRDGVIYHAAEGGLLNPREIARELRDPGESGVSDTTIQNLIKRLRDAMPLAPMGRVIASTRDTVLRDSTGEPVATTDERITTELGHAALAAGRGLIPDELIWRGIGVSFERDWPPDPRAGIRVHAVLRAVGSEQDSHRIPVRLPPSGAPGRSIVRTITRTMDLAVHAHELERHAPAWASRLPGSSRGSRQTSPATTRPPQRDIGVLGRLEDLVAAQRAVPPPSSPTDGAVPPHAQATDQGRARARGR